MSGFPGPFDTSVPRPIGRKGGYDVPFELEHVGDKCRVITKDTGKPHSDKPISCSKARRQLRALWMALKRDESKEKE